VLSMYEHIMDAKHRRSPISLDDFGGGRGAPPPHKSCDVSENDFFFVVTHTPPQKSDLSEPSYLQTTYLIYLPAYILPINQHGPKKATDYQEQRWKASKGDQGRKAYPTAKARRGSGGKYE
jgi:hypothetical protein